MSDLRCMLELLLFFFCDRFAVEGGAKSRPVKKIYILCSDGARSRLDGARRFELFPASVYARVD